MIDVPLRFRILVCLAILTFAHQAISIQLPSGSPATVGLSADRLARMDQVIRASIEKKELPGAVVLVARHGRIAWRKAYGSRAVAPRREPPVTRFLYSDINFVALGEVVHRVSGDTLDEFARRNIFVPLGMRDTGFNPAAGLLPRIAPTERRRGQMNYLGDGGENAGVQGEQWLRGQVHDPTSFRMSGVAGHAGLFSTADDLAIFCQMILHGGAFNGARILSPMAVATMTRPRAIADNGSARGLGWDIATSFSTNKGDLFPLGSFGHTGFTGTSMWIDPASDS